MLTFLFGGLCAAAVFVALPGLGEDLRGRLVEAWASLRSAVGR